MNKILMTILVLMFLFSFDTEAEWIRVKLKTYIDKSTLPYDSLSIVIRDIDCADSMNCFAVGDASGICNIIYRTTDAGRSWNVSYFADFDTIDGIWRKFTFLIKSISYPTVNKCVAGGDSGIVFKTDDGGQTWHRVYTPIFFENTYPAYKQIRHIQMLDSTYGIAVTYTGVFYTSDGGNTWSKIPMPGSETCFVGRAHISSPTTLYATLFGNECPYNHNFARTHDLGKTWEFYDITGTIEGIVRMYFVDSLNGWMVGGIRTGVGDRAIAKIVATTDGGRSWHLQLYDSLLLDYFELWDVSFHDKNNGIAVGRAGKVALTPDGGKNWFADHIPVDLSKVMFLFVPTVCYRNVKEPLMHGGDMSIYYRKNSASVVIEDKSETEGTIVTPNPTENKLIVKSIVQKEIEVYNSIGLKLINSWTNTEIDISDFPSGVYFIRVEGNIIKFIKM